MSAPHLTAHIMIGPTATDGMGVPTHALYLTEVPKLVWTLVPAGLHGDTPQAVERLAWVPTTYDLLEDGLLMLGLHVASFPELRQMADRHFRAGWHGEVELGRDLTLDHRHELHALNRQQDWPQHLVVTVLCHSAFMEQLGSLRQYRFGLDLCSWRYWRQRRGGHIELLVTDENPADVLDDQPEQP